MTNTRTIHKELTRAFYKAFIKATKQGIDVKNLYWFRSEARKDSK